MNERGSIFLETVIATAILALILGATFEILQDSARRARRIDGQREAMMIAQSRLATYPLTRPALAGSQSGEEMGYRWQMDVVPAASPLPAGPLDVSVTVASLRDPAIRVHLRTLRSGRRG